MGEKKSKLLSCLFIFKFYFIPRNSGDFGKEASLVVLFIYLYTHTLFFYIYTMYTHILAAERLSLLPNFLNSCFKLLSVSQGDTGS